MSTMDYLAGFADLLTYSIIGLITGESKPVEINEGEKMVAGAINLGDYVEMTATDTSENSTIAQVRRMVEDAQSKNAALSYFTTRYAEATSLVALVLLLAAYYASHDVLHALAPWVALVPIVFALIVPVATTIGISILAKKGVLVKNAEALKISQRSIRSSSIRPAR